MNVIDLAEADVQTCGSKAATLGVLLRAGLPVPEGFVVPSSKPELSLRQVASALRRIGNPPVAVRSSASDEDRPDASAAGQYESFLAVQGTDAVVSAIHQCWRSASSPRVANYRSKTGHSSQHLAVIVQRLVDADVAGVLFTATEPGEPTRIESSWGLGTSVVSGMVTPDSYWVHENTVHRTIGRKTTRADRGDGVSAHQVPEHLQAAPTLTDGDARSLAALGDQIAQLLGRPQDTEWAIANGTTWLLQSRPITVPLPPVATRHSSSLTGAPGSRGVATGPARVIRSPSEFGRVRAGDIVICPYTDPAWTPLFTIAAGIVTQTGGVLSHAAIVAREYSIPAILGVPAVTDLIPDGARVTIDGASGTLALS